jgi:hypothetical protein
MTNPRYINYQASCGIAKSHDQTYWKVEAFEVARIPWKSQSMNRHPYQRLQISPREDQEIIMIASQTERLPPVAGLGPNYNPARPNTGAFQDHLESLWSVTVPVRTSPSC